MAFKAENQRISNGPRGWGNRRSRQRILGGIRCLPLKKAICFFRERMIACALDLSHSTILRK